MLLKMSQDGTTLLIIGITSLHDFMTSIISNSHRSGVAAMQKKTKLICTQSV